MEVNARSTSTHTSPLAELLLGFGPTLLLVGLFILLARRAQRGGAGGLGGLGSFGRSQARRIDPARIRVTFADVAGIDEAKAELTEIVDFLRDPAPYQRLGGRMPHGVLLSGPPGTGKTLLARAVAGEAHAAFFSIAASEFIEAIVGVGAVAGTRPVRQGQGGRAGDRLYRRARRDRPVAPGLGLSPGQTTSASRRSTRS